MYFVVGILFWYEVIMDGVLDSWAMVDLPLREATAAYGCAVLREYKEAALNRSSPIDERTCAGYGAARGMCMRVAQIYLREDDTVPSSRASWYV
jgi:hypothetical protein